MEPLKPGRTLLVIAVKRAKRSVVTDAAGVPLGIAIEGANRKDQLLLEATLESVPVARPIPTDQAPQGPYWTRAMTTRAWRRCVITPRFVLQIRTRGEEIDENHEALLQLARGLIALERAHAWREANPLPA